MPERQIRFLYGDSEPFEHDYDVLATVRSLMQCLSEVGPLYAEVLELRETVEEQMANAFSRLRQRAEFLGQVLERTDEEAQRFGDWVDEPFHDLVKQIARLVDESQEAHLAQCNQITEELAPELLRLDDELFQSMERFLLSSGLPPRSLSLHQRLAGSRNEIVGQAVFEDQVRVEFEADADTADPFGSPAMLGRFQRGIHITAGTRRNWFGREKPVVLKIEDFTIRRTKLHHDYVELVLRPPGGAENTDWLLRIERKKDDDADEADARPGSDLEAWIRDANSKDNEVTRIPVRSDQMAAISELFAALQAYRTAALDKASAIRTARLPSGPLTGADSVQSLIQHFARLFPVLAEIAHRSPHPRELSLKLEDPSGERSEVYLGRDVVHEALAALPTVLRDLLPADPFAWPPEDDEEEDRPTLPKTDPEEGKSEPDEEPDGDETDNVRVSA